MKMRKWMKNQIKEDQVVRLQQHLRSRHHLIRKMFLWHLCHLQLLLLLRVDLLKRNVKKRKKNQKNQNPEAEDLKERRNTKNLRMKKMMIIEFNINFNLIDITLNYVYCCINFKNTKSNNKIANRRFRDS